ncbi:hypothetical protein C8Q80DRAFT_673459 [Daedaleopsis nitida]|nr:hypothetical protein C8Q80DRAFT_673459 [Daedaleopsis nitida]
MARREDIGHLSSKLGRGTRPAQRLVYRGQWYTLMLPSVSDLYRYIQRSPPPPPTQMASSVASMEGWSCTTSILWSDTYHPNLGLPQHRGIRSPLILTTDGQLTSVDRTCSRGSVRPPP